MLQEWKGFKYGLEASVGTDLVRLTVSFRMCAAQRGPLSTTGADSALGRDPRSQASI